MSWRVEIEKFDAELTLRIKVILRHEITGIDFDSFRWGRKALGFPDRFHFPWWKDETKAWRDRNRPRYNERARVQQRLWRLNHLKEARERDKRYYYEDIERSRAKARKKAGRRRLSQHPQTTTGPEKRGGDCEGTRT